ncbi:unnamed protein product (macronuclear) [Paramecium tetraurelia]|uniref:Uncharacterized protein n=1 Tax=Paramecium tetraurelia TaxID=5888 RepID=A0DDD8_PARTE|nr:uncharacterized protein GSPATT00015914001 [Paramecium tetraurelia]CAK81055.1 unnamed protein product [Paramecium tetraurelia]|eukprot:XP_001448452.1 hypothetical protein (macronuclear) [Paramecium tetraurelia strain d4-2]
MPLAQCGGLCLRVTKELGAKLEVTNQKIVLIEDVKFSDNRTELYFIGELYHLNEQDLIEARKTENVRRILIDLYKAYNSLLKQNKQLDFSLYNLFQVQDQLKVLDIGVFNKKVQKDSTPTNQLALLILKLFLSRQQYKPLRYMNCEQQVEYIRNFNDFLILLPMLEDIQKRISWENLGYYLLSDSHKQEAPPVAVYYKQPYKLNSTLNSYSLAVQRMQSNLRSRSKRHLGSLYEQQKTSFNGQEDDSQENHRVIRSRRTIHPNVNLIKPGSMQSTPNHYKMEHPNRQSPIILNTQSQTQQIRSQFKTENSLQTIQQNISYDNFFLKTQTITPQDSQSKFVSINASVSQNLYTSENQVTNENEQLSTLQQLQEKSTIQHEKRIFKLPQHKQLPPNDNESTIKVIKFEEDLVKEFEQYSEKYKQYIECLNMIGKTVAKCITTLDAKNNLWMMPLFIVFKRMYQLRISLQDSIQNNQNIFQLQHFQEFAESQKYQEFQKEFIDQNNIVKNEVQTLLQNCEFKIDKLDKKNQQKINPLLNLNLDQSIRDISFIYFYQQIYSYIKKLMVERPKQAQQLRDLIIKIQCSLLIMDQAVADFKFDLKEYNNRKQDELYRQENELKLEKIKMRIQKNGYQF